MLTEGKTKSNRKEHRPDIPRPVLSPPAQKALKEPNEMNLFKQFIKELKNIPNVEIITHKNKDVEVYASAKRNVDIMNLIEKYEFILGK